MERRVSPDRLAALLGPAVDRAPAYLSIADGVRLLVSDRRIPPGTRLPSERELTVALGVSRTTVTRAYGHLRDQGFLVSR
jgi:DNA-binding GntR family transcriptional regulator